ncbi:MAG: DNA polymerase III subunit gamma/tau [Lachnospiraceae bacterium]|nr:DNA polymerase III subunit gamma/tau [Candidatus Hippenecus merdae]
MAYQALYRKWRPTTFDEVVGQEAVTETLKNQIRTGKIGHAYLFCGTRGCGKTSVAKILARAVNCPEAVNLNGNPCNACSICTSISRGSSMNVFEIDAASNNGVDNIRDIREQVEYPPTEGKYKVYIIDEVHMLSTGAFNALLKTLEEPPAYVIFILATTDPQKVPQTILSRCQRYDFRRMKKATLMAQIRKLGEAEGFTAEEKACAAIAEAADGSMRDALSILDQCLAYAKGEPLTYEKVLEVLGAADVTVFSQLFGAVVEGNAAKALSVVDEAVASGKEAGLLLNDYIWYLRNLLVCASSGNDESILEVNEDSLELIRKDAALLPVGSLMGMISDMAELSARVRTSTQKRVLLEVELIRMAGVPAQGAPVRMASVRAAAAPARPAPEPAPTPKEDLSNIGEKLQIVKSRWQDLVQQLSPSNRVLFGGVELTEARGGIVVIFKNRINFTLASKNQENGLIRLQEIARETLGVNVPFLARQAKPGEFPEAEEKITDEDIKKINFPVDIEN